MIDAPGHRDFIKYMITSSVAVAVLEADGPNELNLLATNLPAARAVRAPRRVPAVRPRGGEVRNPFPVKLNPNIGSCRKRWGSATGEVSSKVDTVNLCTAPIGCLRSSEEKEGVVSQVSVVHPVGGFWGVALARTVPLSR